MKKQYSILAAAAVAAVGSVASAAPFALETVLVSTTGNSGSYVSSLSGVTSGELIYYEVTTVLNSSGTINAYKGYTLGTQVDGTEGINNVSFDLTSSDAGVTAINSALSVSGGTSDHAGTANGGTVTGVEAQSAPGVFVGAATAATLLTGSFLAGSASTDTLSGNWDTSLGNGSVKVLRSNAATTAITVNNSSETTSNSYFGFTGAVLTEGGPPPVPAPAIVPALGALVSGLGMISLVRRRRTV